MSAGLIHNMKVKDRVRLVLPNGEVVEFELLSTRRDAARIRVAAPATVRVDLPK